MPNTEHGYYQRIAESIINSRKKYDHETVRHVLKIATTHSGEKEGYTTKLSAQSWLLRVRADSPYKPLPAWVGE